MGENCVVIAYSDVQVLNLKVQCDIYVYPM